MKSENVYLDLRNQVLNQNPKNIGIDKTTPQHAIWGIVMETGFPEGSFTLVALIDGSASIYFSGGSGIIGGGNHENVNKEAKKINHLADGFFEYYKTAETHPLPNSGETIFYILTEKGTYTAKALEEDLGEEKHGLSPLFFACHALITELRLINENK